MVLKTNNRIELYRCELCNTILLRRNKTKHNQTKKHKYYSNLILNRCVIKNVEVIKFKDIFNPYFIKNTKKFNLFIFVDDIDPRNLKTNISINVTYIIQSDYYSGLTTEIASYFLHRYIAIYLFHECSPGIILQIEIAFISDLMDITGDNFLRDSFKNL